MASLLIDDKLLKAVRQVSGAGNERKIVESLLWEWLNKQAKNQPATKDDDSEWPALQREKALYADKYPPSTIEPPGTPTFYKGPVISIDDMTERAKRAVGEHFKHNA